MSATGDWFAKLPPEERHALDEIARNSVLQLPMCPPDYHVLEELLAWQQVEIDVMDAHADWLASIRAKFEHHGIEWTTGNLSAHPELWEADE